MAIQRALKRGDVREFDQSYNKGFKSIWASEVDADFDLLFTSYNFGPIGDAGGDLTGTYPNPVIAPLAVTTAKLANDAVTNSKILNTTIEVAKLAPSVTSRITPPYGLPEAGKGLAVDPSGTFLQWIVGGFSGVPGGPAGGDLSGTYPNPSVVNDSHNHTAATLPATIVYDGDPAGGDLGGTYPNPAVAKINGSLLGTTTPTSGYILRANGTLWSSELAPSSASLTAAVGSHFKNLLIRSNSVTQVTVEADELGIQDQVVSGVNVLLNITTTGMLGLDTGVEAANTWYAVWIGLNPLTSAVTGVLSTSFVVGGLSLTGPLAAFTKWRRVGAVRNNNSSDLLFINQVGRRCFYDQTADATMRVLNAGGATVKTGVLVTGLVPETAYIATLEVQLSGGALAAQGYIYASNSVIAGVVGTYRVESDATFITMMINLYVGPIRQFQYLVTAGRAMTVYVVDYEDRI